MIIATDTIIRIIVAMAVVGIVKMPLERGVATLW